MTGHRVRLLFNAESSHGDELADLFSRASRFDCMVAFANLSGLMHIVSALEAALSNGMEARFAVGLDFYQTSPNLLYKLLSLEKTKRLQLFISVSRYTFHPKVYAFAFDSGCTIVTGSANLTSGGFAGNYEASTVVEDPSGQLMSTLSQYFDGLIEENELIPANKKLIDDYAQRHTLYHAHHFVANKRFSRAINDAGAEMLTLREILAEMKTDMSESGFASQIQVRRACREGARKIIQDLATGRRLGPEDFVLRYEDLISHFHSGGLHRGKNVIAKSPGSFLDGLASITKSIPDEPSDAYRLLHEHFLDVDRAGVNVITEILHAIDSDKFAVMNQNAVSGLRKAKITDFPPKPTKKNVNPDTYASFCEKATHVRNQLGLRDFTELDALFNYAYWHPIEELDEPEE
ncbi:NgoFVII family restriction endonuclease [Burkholderia multivorans]|uniref:phospholipase D family protein n=1 Tax=Burkholderia ubonensis TaxID=101571 RepID=UPI000F6D273F|nr:phospholipase D family protein [Burkholderia ubonensis]AYZ61829.1 NgoFVII family restriction endonuclease [Burkholderia multivorans]VWB55574.1 hypothetical protein BUB20358_02548 [Burkholderia ubonensis]